MKESNRDSPWIAAFPSFNFPSHTAELVLTVAQITQESLRLTETCNWLSSKLWYFQTPRNFFNHLRTYTTWLLAFPRWAILQQEQRWICDAFLFFFFFLCWVFIVAQGLSLVTVSWGCFSLWSMGFSLQWLLLLQSTHSRRKGSSSWGTQV